MEYLACTEPLRYAGLSVAAATVVVDCFQMLMCDPFHRNMLTSATANASCLVISSSIRHYIFNRCSSWNGVGVVKFLLLFSS